MMDFKALRHSQKSSAQKYARGGAVHTDEAMDKKLIRQELAKFAAKDKKMDMKMMDDAEGMKRGGRAKSSKKPEVKVNIVNMPRQSGADPEAALKAQRQMPPMPMAASPMPPRAPMMKRGGCMK